MPTSKKIGVIRKTFNPILIGNLQAWYKADVGIILNGSTVLQWNDQSGNGRDLKQSTPGNQPTLLTNYINGKPALDFDGSNDYLELDSVFSSTDQVTYFIVYRRDVDSNQGIITAGSGNYAYLQYGSTFYIGSSTRNAAMVNDTWYIRAGQASADASFSEAFSNGISLGTDGDPGAGSRTFKYLGQYNDQPANFLNGKVAELLYFDKLLTSTEMGNVFNYLNSKYSVY